MEEKFFDRFKMTDPSLNWRQISMKHNFSSSEFFRYFFCIWFGFQIGTNYGRLYPHSKRRWRHQTKMAFQNSFSAITSRVSFLVLSFQLEKTKKSCKPLKLYQKKHLKRYLKLVAPSSFGMRIYSSIICSYLKRRLNAKVTIFFSLEQNVYLIQFGGHFKTYKRLFESVKKLFFRQLWLTKCLTKIKRENAKMLNFRGIMTETSIFESHFYFEGHFETKQNSTRFKTDNGSLYTEIELSKILTRSKMCNRGIFRYLHSFDLFFCKRSSIFVTIVWLRFSDLCLSFPCGMFLRR
jgi:hypothetical protein